MIYLIQGKRPNGLEFWYMLRHSDVEQYLAQYHSREAAEQTRNKLNADSWTNYTIWECKPI